MQAQRIGARFAREAYATPIPDEIRQRADLLLLNCYPLDADPIQTPKAFWPQPYFERAYTIAINLATDGVLYHGLFDQIDYTRFVRRIAEREPMELPAPCIGERDQLLVCSEHFPVE